MKRLLILGLALLLPVSAFAQMPPPRMITVSGDATDNVAPDQAILNVSLVSKAVELNAAKQHNDGLVDKLVTITRDYKIPKDKVATSNLYISPEYNYDHGRQRFIGYTVNRSLRITMDDLAIYERLLSAIVDAKIDQVNGIEFQLADPDAHAEKVRTKAVSNARAKAETLARAAGAKVGQVISISTIGDSRPMPPMPMARMMAADAMEKSSVAQTLPGMVTLYETVNVTFALE